MIFLFRPLAGAAPAADSWVPVLLDGGTAAVFAIMGTTLRPGAVTLHAPAAPTQGAYRGVELDQFGGDFYDRIHISDALLDLGNVIGQQQRAVSVWNAFRRNQPLAALTALNDEGITLDGQPAPPIDFAVLQERVYTLTVSTEGPPTIDASFTWDFEPYDIVLRVVGSRVTAWTFLPDWSSPIVERLEWKTDVLTSYDGSEQVRALRIAPRKAYEFEAFFAEKARRYAEAILWGWGARVWSLPIWPDGLDLPAIAAGGSTEIMLDTVTRDYRAGGLAMIVADEFAYEVVEVLAVLADRLQLKRPLSSTWPAGTRIYPARTARLGAQVRLPRWTGDASTSRVSFDLAEPVDVTPDAGPVLYRGLPVLESRPEWGGGLELEMQRKLAALDNLTGLRMFEDESGMPTTLQVMRWTWTSRAEQDAYRRHLYAMRGRFGRVWVPTWALDLKVAALIAASATNIDVEFTAYTKQIALSPNRRDVRIELTTGEIFYRRITGADDIGGGLERLGLDSPLGILVQPEQVASVSFMALSRLESDTVELSHWTGEICDSVTTHRSSRNGV